MLLPCRNKDIPPLMDRPSSRCKDSQTGVNVPTKKNKSKSVINMEIKRYGLYNGSFSF